MRVLIDTNIIIKAEEPDAELEPKLAEMLRWCAQQGCVLYTRPDQTREIERDKNEKRRKLLLSRMARYPQIEAEIELGEAELERYGWRQENENDRMDNLLLHALCRGAVNYFITEDRGIHKKAQKAEVGERVHYVAQFHNHLASLSQEELSPPGGIERGFLYQLDVQQEFFASLREGYEGYDQWFKKVAEKKRQAWCITNNETKTVQAICIYKEEDTPEIINDRGDKLDGAALKLCTFKVGENIRGRKIGERLLYTAFQYAAEKKIPYVYLHIFGEEQEMLVSLCENFGFQGWGTYKKRDQAYAKTMRPPTSPDAPPDPLEYAIRYYPLYADDRSIKKFIVPIRPEYHQDLFPDAETHHNLFSDDSSQCTPEANTIKKAYICHSGIKKIERGSLLLFYRSDDHRDIRCIGVVEQVYRGDKIDDVLPLVSKRTVYSKLQVAEWMEKETLVILFRFMRGIEPVGRAELKQSGVRGAIQSIREIDHDVYRKCFPASTA